MKQKIHTFLERPTNYDRLITGCICSFFAAVVVTLAVVVIAVGGWDNLKYTAKFAEILAVTEHTYIGEADAEEVSDAAFTAMIDTLGDRWSYYMTAEEYDAYQERSANQYTGIGITIQTMEDGSLVIRSVTENSPAMRAGLTPGMTLVAFNGEELIGKTTSEVGTLIRGAEGKFTLTTLDEQGNRADFVLAAEKIYSSPVSFEMLEDDIGYIQLANFDEGCAEEAQKAIENLIAQGAKGLIFDVRNNGGGYVTELTALLDVLLPEGEIFVSVDSDGDEKITKSDEKYIDLPMAVLVNSKSYSAAEFFAAALDEYDAAVTVGEATTGKGRSQTNVVLVDGSAVHISSKRYLTPNRVDLSEQGGIIPDIVMDLGESDDQLAAAKEFLLTQG